MSTPRAYEPDRFPWNLDMVPPTIEVGGKEEPHPALTSGIFVVHGMGSHTLSETAASLRSGIEDALEKISRWQRRHRVQSPLGDPRTTPPPFVSEGYWANYTDLRESFPDDWAGLNEIKERGDFFERLWRVRTVSASRTFIWFIGQQLRLLNPGVIFDVGLLAWILYWPLQLVSLTILLFLLLFRRRWLTDILADVRLYVAPKGVVERAIVQRIDYRVGEAFLRMIGLDWNFRPLRPTMLHAIKGKKLRFTRVIWVAHSLGSVISYNVLSDLFTRAHELETSGDEKQKRGVHAFRTSLGKFVTIGSPLDKIAYLFKHALRPWGGAEFGNRKSEVGRWKVEQKQEDRREKVEDRMEKQVEGDWWVNFYHVLDPVSGSLSSEVICGKQSPANFHVGLAKIPGVAHFAYWKDNMFLRFLLSHVYGKRFLHDREYRPSPAFLLTLYAVVGYLVWAVLIVGLLPGLYFLADWLMKSGLAEKAAGYVGMFVD